MCRGVGSRISEVRERWGRCIQGGDAGVCVGWGRIKTGRLQERKGKRETDRDSGKGIQREREEESQRLHSQEQRALVCRDCVWVGEGDRIPCISGLQERASAGWSIWKRPDLSPGFSMSP